MPSRRLRAGYPGGVVCFVARYVIHTKVKKVLVTVVFAWEMGQNADVYDTLPWLRLFLVMYSAYV